MLEEMKNKFDKLRVYGKQSIQMSNFLVMALRLEKKFLKTI